MDWCSAWRLFTMACILWVFPTYPTVVGPDDLVTLAFSIEQYHWQCGSPHVQHPVIGQVLPVPEVDDVGIVFYDPDMFC
jgi:hypothetical protein